MAELSNVLVPLVLEGQVFDIKLINRFLAQLLDALQQFLRGLFQMQHTEIASSVEDRRYIILSFKSLR